ncbi:hypothetical protein SAMN05444682_111198 [Parapedobacter indicus]|uniref:Uncharacterized protein n=1 Tax=Parapedobacter indicus TaxID=1477437 RepID=A0A1I3SV64_9SPHI|nr:hypothetical protein CLV26_1111 [Parapedobacter indicus]SFJ62685.1 hypothetical protein SAMN05444682_111198 [Parapedobacter indicus]
MRLLFKPHNGLGNISSIKRNACCSLMYFIGLAKLVK